MAVAIGTMARLKNGGAWSFFPGGAETAVEAFGPGVEVQIRPVGEVFDLETLAAVSAPTINQPEPISIMQGVGLTDNVAARVSGGVPPYIFTQVPAAPLPLGVTITAGGNLTVSNQFPAGEYGWSVRVIDSRLTDGESDPQSATINYTMTVTAQPQVTPSLAVFPGQNLGIDNVTPESGTLEFRLRDGPYESTNFIYVVNAADLAAGPVCIVPPAIIGTPENGQTLVSLPGFWVSLSQNIIIEGAFTRDMAPIGDVVYTGTIYNYMQVDQNADGDSYLSFSETASDANGTRTAARQGLFVQPAPTGISAGVTNLGPFSNVQSGFDRSIPIDLGPSDPNKTIVAVITMDGNITASTVRIEANGAEYPLNAVQSASAGSIRLRHYEGPCPIGGSAVLKWTQAVGFEKTNRIQLFATKNVTRKIALGGSMTTTEGVPYQNTVPVSQGDFVILALATPESPDPFIDTIFGTKIIDAVGANMSRFFVAIGQAQNTNPSLPIGVTPPASGSSAHLRIVYGA